MFLFSYIYRQTAQAAKQSTDVLGDVKPPSSWEFSKPDSKKKTSKPEIDYFDFSTNWKTISCQIWYIIVYKWSTICRCTFCITVLEMYLRKLMMFTM